MPSLIESLWDFVAYFAPDPFAPCSKRTNIALKAHDSSKQVAQVRRAIAEQITKTTQTDSQTL